MKTAAIVPARIERSPEGLPSAVDFDDVYHPRAGALEQARHVFLAGNGLPGRWAGRERFVIAETGFGLGNNFLAAWDARRSDPARSERLFFVSIENRPPCRDDVARAQAGSPWPALAAQLVQAWPPPGRLCREQQRLRRVADAVRQLAFVGRRAFGDHDGPVQSGAVHLYAGPLTPLGQGLD